MKYAVRDFVKIVGYFYVYRGNDLKNTCKIIDRKRYTVSDHREIIEHLTGKWIFIPKKREKEIIPTFKFMELILDLIIGTNDTYKKHIRSTFNKFKDTHFLNGCHIVNMLKEDFLDNQKRGTPNCCLDTFIKITPQKTFFKNKEEIKKTFSEMGCLVCKKSPQKLKECSDCLVTYYCSEECQCANWKKGHKFDCKVIKLISLLQN